MSRYCHQCGTLLDNLASFCTNCGTSLEAVASTSVAPSPMVSSALPKEMSQTGAYEIPAAISNLQAHNPTPRMSPSRLVAVASACLLIGSVFSLGLRELGLLNFALGKKLRESEVEQRADSAYEAGMQNGRDLGFNDGKTEGYSQGEEAGLQKGYEQGYEEGKSAGGSAGYDNGYAAGLSEGQTIGYDEGEKAGYDAGKKDGYGTGFSDGCDAVFEQVGYAGAVVAYSPATRTYGRSYVLRDDVC